MPDYTVKVFTATRLTNIVQYISIRLQGKSGTSDWTSSSGWKSISGFINTWQLNCPNDLGDLILVNLQKQQISYTPEFECFVEKVEATSSEGKVFKFPIYHWLKRTKEYSFYEGKALIESEQNYPSVKSIRDIELKRRAEKYRWKEYKPDLPKCMTADQDGRLPSEVQFSFKKDIDFKLTAAQELVTMKLTSLSNSKEPWKDFNSIEQMLANKITSDVSKYVKENWKEDAFFGYQFLNGVNPIMIRRCSSLPTNFPVTDTMLNLNLSDEMKNGNIFLCDYKNLDGVETSKINGEEQYLMAPLVLLHKTPDNEMKPVAIQLKQTASKNNPIFLPTDSEYDWLLAKTFVTSADFNEHQLEAHLLRTHLLAEVFTVSLLRNVPKVHPLYKLLIPHTRFTLHINLMARQSLISENGLFTMYSAASEKGMTTILQRSRLTLTYKSLCIKEDIKERGMESVPNYYYRDDGFKLWDIIEKFVKGVLTHYYKTQKQVQQDTQLQKYIRDIFVHGFGSNVKTGIPQKFKTVAELVKFATMVIFTCSAQHAAVNNGQFDFGVWMPNTPTSLQRAPPTKKGSASEETLLQTLPDGNTTANAVSVLRLLSTQSSDFVPLGQFPCEHFTEDVPCQMMKDFCKALRDLDQEIDKRNEGIYLPYTYLKPTLMENSVSI